ncbi:MAG TPA: peptidoglycan DD-metalloendopeptidase family protein, partial [Thermoanaerobaculia bacterium]|nr:peptidoglycan DD-metalloendopeptidase family protein [Thermoanaerobaculia bacterium]
MAAAPLRWEEGDPAPILPPEWAARLAAIRPLDLSAGSLLLGADPRHLTPAGLRELLARELREHGSEMSAQGEEESPALGLGIYGEARLLGPLPPAPGTEPASIHLGADLFLPAGTEIRAPFAGRVVEVAIPPTGPRLLLEHGRGEVRFRTLWIGLEAASLADLLRRDSVARGTPIGRIADSGGNGGWPPSLHLQLIRDDLDLGARFPTAARPSEREVWQALSPD